MKRLTLIMVWLFGGTLCAQTQLNKTVPVRAGQTIRMHFDFPELVRVTTWEKNEIFIGGTVSINGGENDDAFGLETNVQGGTISIRGEIKNLEGLPHRITVHRDGQKIVFRNKAEWRKYRDEHGKGDGMTSNGVDMDILLDIKVPRNTETYVESVYGTVEIRDFTGPLNVEATYGGVDAALAEQSTGELIAETNYGHIYSNLNVKFGSGDVRDEDFHTYVAVKPGSGPRYRFESQYGNVYLRRK